MDKPVRDESELSFFNEKRKVSPKNIPPDEDTGLDELIKAFGRVGIQLGVGINLEKNEKNKLQWLLNFAHLNLPKISAGDWINLKFEFLAFQSGYTSSEISVKGNRLIGCLNKKDLELFHSSIKKKLNQVIDEKSVDFDTGPIVFHINPRMDFKITENENRTLHEEIIIKNEPWKVSPVTATKWGASQYYLSVLIARFAHLIRRCPECNKLFLADRKNQSFCSLKHQNYAAGRKWRKSKGLITGKPRGRPRKNPPKKKGGA